MVMHMREASVLDRVDEMASVDRSGMLDASMRIAEHCRDAARRAGEVEIPREVRVSGRPTIRYGRPRRVVVAGMGGSAIGGEFLRDWLRHRVPVPVEVCRDYALPAYAGRGDLVFAVSYSGNTEETLSALLDAVRRGCMIIAVTSGGHLQSFAEGLRIPCLRVPAGVPAPRVAIPYLFFPLPVLLEKAGVPLGVEGEMEEAVRVLEALMGETAPQTPTAENPSKRLAVELVGTVPLVYGFRQYGAVAHRLKTQFNENSKVPAWHDAFPELDHNEVVGWEAPEALTKAFSVVLLRDRGEPPEIRRRIEATRRLALHKARRVLEVHARGEGTLAKMLSLMHIGDLASIYLAILRGVDPTPTETINSLKGELAREFDMVAKLQREAEELKPAIHPPRPSR